MGTSRASSALVVCDHLAHLQSFTSSLLDAETVDEIAEVAVAELRRAFAADAAELAVVSDGGGLLAFAGAAHASRVPPGERAPSVEGALPLFEVFQTGSSSWLLPDGDEEPLSCDTARPQRVIGCALLAVGGQRVGALGMAYATGPQGLAAERALFHDYAGRVALAVGRAQACSRAQEQRRRADEERERAESANRAKDEFLAMLGHELRNPLSPILAAVQLMRLRADGVLVRERSIIEHQVEHMVRLVDDLMDVSRITRGHVELRTAPVEIARVIAEAIERASPILEQRAHRLVTSVPSSGLTVQADAGRLAQAVANLLTNAAKYSPPGGVIDVEVRSNGERVEIIVRDQGIGIDPALLPHIFELFVQGRQSPDRPYGGLGLGLAIAKNLAELHGGTLRAASEGLGKGSVFTLECELAVISSIERSEPSSTKTSAAVRGRRILVVDDNRDAVEMLGDFLESAGHVVRVTHDGPSALSVAAEFRPELALLDLGLPGMDGHELASRLRSLLQHDVPKLVAITGYGALADRRRSHEAGFDRHLVKPLDLDRFRQLVIELFPEPAGHGDAVHSLPRGDPSAVAAALTRGGR